MWLLDGIAACPRTTRRSRSHARQPRSARRELVLRAARRRDRTASNSPPRPRRAARARCCGSRAPIRRAPPSRRCSRRRSRIAQVGGPHCRSVLQLAVIAAAHRRHHRHQRQDHLRLPAGAMPGAPRQRRRLHGHHRLGPHRRARAPAYHARCRQRAPHARAAAAQGVREVAMEVSSHALDQGRVDGVRFHSAAFTNLSRDHLDYHGLDATYGAAKARLFAAENCSTSSSTSAMPSAASSRRLLRPRAADGGLGRRRRDRAWLAERSLHASGKCARFARHLDGLDGSFGTQHVSTRLMGRFNAENSLVVLAACCRSACRSTRPPRARRVHGAARPHGGDRAGGRASPWRWSTTRTRRMRSPRRLAALREHCSGALWCVFGCGGDRDPGKRPLMGAIADELADQIIVTDDNPRSENPQDITAAITGGIKSHAARVIHDRGAAIAAALNEAQPPMWCSSPARDTRITRSTARRAAASATGARRCASWGAHDRAAAMKRTLQDAAQAVGGRLVGEDRPTASCRPTAAR
jgi:hypothetical protein